MTVTCYYSCTPCGVIKAPFQIEERGQAEDIRVFMDRVIAEVARVHRIARPACRERQLTNLMIPAPKSGIGKPYGS